MTDAPKSLRGFASLTPERRREIAAMGGASVRPHLRSFSTRPELAKQAGRKGGADGREITDAFRAMVVSLALRKSSTVAAQKHGLSRSTVCRWVKELAPEDAR